MNFHQSLFTMDNKFKILAPILNLWFFGRTCHKIALSHIKDLNVTQKVFEKLYGVLFFPSKRMFHFCVFPSCVMHLPACMQ